MYTLLIHLYATDGHKSIARHHRTRIQDEAVHSPTQMINLKFKLNMRSFCLGEGVKLSLLNLKSKLSMTYFHFGKGGGVKSSSQKVSESVLTKECVAHANIASHLLRLARP